MDGTLARSRRRDPMFVTLIALFAVAMVAPWIFRFTGRQGF